MKKYRKVKKGDKFPALPQEMRPKYILVEKDWTLIFCVGMDYNYTIIWDRITCYPNQILRGLKN